MKLQLEIERRMFERSEMSILLGELVVDPGLKLEVIHMPQGGRERPVTWVHATEQLDPRPHIRSSELICTLGTSLVRPGSAVRFVEAVANAGSAGICLGLGEVHIATPPDLQRAATEAGIPLVALPHGVPFLAVNDSIINRQSVVQSAVRRRSAALLTELTRLAQDGKCVDDLLEIASAKLDGSIVRTSNGRYKWDGAGQTPPQDFLAQLWGVLDFAERVQSREVALKRRRVGQLIDLIADGLAHPSSIAPEVTSSGLDENTLLVSCWPKDSETVLASHWHDALIGTSARGVIAISSPERTDVVSELGLVCGYGAPQPLSRLSQAVTASQAAFKLARSRGGVVGAEQLVTFEALLEQLHPEHLFPFGEQLLRPVFLADEDGKSHLMETLRVYFDHDGSLQSTADHMYVHVNTVRNRLARIKTLSRRDPASMRESFDLLIALRAVDLRIRSDRRRTTRK